MKQFPRNLWLFAILVAIVTTIPYLVGIFFAPDGWVYHGSLPIPGGFTVDYNSHMAKMWQGARGDWDYRLLFTHEDHIGLNGVQGFYVALGAISSLFSLSFPVVYHLARIILIIALVFALWRFAARFFTSSRECWIVLLLGTVAAGWSWVLLIFPSLTAEVSPIEFWLFDAFTILAMIYMPHFVAAILLQIVAFLALDAWLSRGGGWRALTIMTFALQLDAFIQPYAAPVLVMLVILLGAYHTFSAKTLHWRRAIKLALPLFGYGVVVLAQYVAMQADPIWADFVSQNITASPNILFYIFGYAPFIIPILFGARHFLLGEKQDDIWWLPLFWLFLVAALLYAPLPTQRRYLLGVQTPLAVLAAYGWAKVLLPRFSERYQAVVFSIYILFAALAPLALILFNTVQLSEDAKPLQVYSSPDEVAAYMWVQQNTEPYALFLTTFDWSGSGSGGKLVAMTGRRAFLGHWIETARFDDKIAQAQRFYNAATSDEWRQNFLEEIGADYLWYSDFERAWGEWNPADADYLTPVFTKGTVTIYAVP
ncbi:MAG: hypothetical protein D6712_00235 [Chloroflexi bacterium]|nr:MAG: hypothetical protein D6712_00235 [Chloroflexota bacterium]